MAITVSKDERNQYRMHRNLHMQFYCSELSRFTSEKDPGIVAR